MLQYCNTDSKCYFHTTTTRLTWNGLVVLVVQHDPGRLVLGHVLHLLHVLVGVEEGLVADGDVAARVGGVGQRVAVLAGRGRRRRASAPGTSDNVQLWQPS